jgi:uncharacterized membrane protein
VSRTALVLLLMCATATAQPLGRDMREQHERRVAEMDRDFTRDSFWMFFAFAAFAVFAIGVKVVSGARRQRRGEWTPPIEYAPLIQASAGTLDVTSIRIGIDGRASKFVRTELEAIAKTYAENTPETRARKLREVSVMLRRVRDSWIYGGADNEPMRPPEEAFSMFAKHVDEARTRIRGGSQPLTPHGPPVSLILVSVIVVARGELMTVTDLATGEDLRRALESASHRAADEILALEVVWIPDRDAQHVSSADLESVYRRSELHALDGAVVGKVFCTYCNGPFPAELVSCPHCGGPAPGRERGR